MQPSFLEAPREARASRWRAADTRAMRGLDRIDVSRAKEPIRSPTAYRVEISLTPGPRCNRKSSRQVQAREQSPRGHCRTAISHMPRQVRHELRASSGRGKRRRTPSNPVERSHPVTRPHSSSPVRSSCPAVLVEGRRVVRRPLLQYGRRQRHSKERGLIKSGLVRAGLP